VADVDLDGVPEIIAGPSAYRLVNGELKLVWTRRDLPDGFVGIGNFDDDPYAEIVIVGGGKVYMLNHDGTDAEVWNPQGGHRPITLSGGFFGPGGAPTIADYDSDGIPEIGIAGSSSYTVLKRDGTVLWSSPTRDFSSGTTGSTAFDFDGDGQAEVVYRDEQFLRIYRGADGRVLFEMPMRSSTATEMPVVADVDHDGNAEIVVCSDRMFGGTVADTGIYVIEDANDTWVNTRPIWNQHSYHVTNINDDATVPLVEANNWQLFNNYRQNVPPAGESAHAAPDLVPSFVRVAEAGGQLTVTARVGNAGIVFVAPGVDVTFYDGDPKAGGVRLGTAKTTGRLEPGRFEDVALTVPSAFLTDVWVAADDDGTGRGHVSECDENNNLYHSFTGLPGANRPPVITSAPVTTATEGKAYRYDVEAADPDGDPPTFALRLAPARMTIDPATGVIDWTPASGESGPRAVQVVVDDGKHGRAVQTFTIDVAEAVNTPPHFTTTPPTAAVVGQRYQYPAAATDPEGDLLQYDLVVSPEGMTVQPFGGRVSWTPAGDQVGVFDVILRVQDGLGGVDLQAFQVTAGAANTAPLITSRPPSAAAVVGLPYQYPVCAQDAEGDALTFRLVAGPAGMAIDPATGVLTWAPAADQTGSQHVILAVSDTQGAEGRQEFDLVAVADAPNHAPAITSTPRIVISLDRAYFYAVAASDADADPLSFRLDAAPGGMTIDATGLVRWTSTAAQFGANAVTVRVEDGRGGVATQDFVIDVRSQATNQPPAV
ncbi:MAG TPA: putative Ig domain-containing protein, partial [Gemmataceae bacterium]|nr:putative Ig domain-containing protein [Gemmataceae bacterium]